MNKKLLKYVCICVLVFTNTYSIFAKRKVSFLTEDGVNVTADLYFKSNSYPYIVLFHQHSSSRGEFNEIAERLTELKYNCLAVDLRNGESENYVQNETASYARNKGYICDYAEAGKDVEAAIKYAFKESGQAVVLLGSFYSATLSLKYSINNGRVSAVVAFEPGEFLKPGYVLEEHIKDIDKPVFIASKNTSMEYIKKMLKLAGSNYVTYFTPSNEKGPGGAKALWKESENNKEYWLALLMFFSKL